MQTIFPKKGKNGQKFTKLENILKKAKWCPKLENALKKGRWLCEIIAHNKLPEKALFM